MGPCDLVARCCNRFTILVLLIWLTRWRAESEENIIGFIFLIIMILKFKLFVLMFAIVFVQIQLCISIHAYYVNSYVISDLLCFFKSYFSIVLPRCAFSPVRAIVYWKFNKILGVFPFTISQNNVHRSQPRRYHWLLPCMVYLASVSTERGRH